MKQFQREQEKVIDYKHLKNLSCTQPVLTEHCNTQQKINWRKAAYSPLMIIVSAAASFFIERTVSQTCPTLTNYFHNSIEEDI